MPRPRKTARLWLRPARKRKDRTDEAATWIILDGGKHIATGCGAREGGKAETILQQYIAEKYAPSRRERDIDRIPVADVINVYLDDCAPKQANPAAVAKRCGRLLDFFGNDTLADINGERCRKYAKSRGRKGGARRDLEDLRAAINHHAKEGLHRAIVNVHLPEKGEPRDRWLTRKEAAQLLWACWRAREEQRRNRGFGMRAHKRGKKTPTAKHTLRHLARFILVGLYTGSRATPIARASFHAAAGRSYVDLDQGMFYRRPEGARITKKRQPPVPIPPRLLAHVRRWKRLGIADQFIVEWYGEPVKSVKTAMKSAVKKSKLEGKITPHTLRHTAATWQMQAGTDIWQAAGYLGMTVETLEHVYGHHHPEYMSEAASNAGAKPKRPNASPTKPVNQTETRRAKA